VAARTVWPGRCNASAHIDDAFWEVMPATNEAGITWA
jgi:hypothetical protein